MKKSNQILIFRAINLQKSKFEIYHNGHEGLLRDAQNTLVLVLGPNTLMKTCHETGVEMICLVCYQALVDHTEQLLDDLPRMLKICTKQLLDDLPRILKISLLLKWRGGREYLK
ncbi:hypothetical protein Peur_066694 [Populus x canadensis]